MIEIKSLRTAGNLKAIVDELIFLRKQNKLSQSDLASAVGISQPYLSKIEKGKSLDIPFDLIVKLLGLFEVDLFIGKINTNNK
jgi:transcriptional regulator with XRE-family HTH domain